MPSASTGIPQRSTHRVTGATFLEEGGILTLQLENGGTVTASNEKFREALSECSQRLIPAAPGTFQLHCARWEGRLQIRKTAVIAWSIDSNGYPDPITVAGPSVGGEPLPTILHPDRSVDVPLGHYDSYESWLEDIRLERCPERKERGSGGGRPDTT